MNRYVKYEIVFHSGVSKEFVINFLADTEKQNIKYEIKANRFYSDFLHRTCHLFNYYIWLPEEQQEADRFISIIKKDFGNLVIIVKL